MTRGHCNYFVNTSHHLNLFIKLNTHGALHFFIEKSVCSTCLFKIMCTVPKFGNVWPSSRSPQFIDWADANDFHDVLYGISRFFISLWTGRCWSIDFQRSDLLCRALYTESKYIFCSYENRFWHRIKLCSQFRIFTTAVSEACVHGVKLKWIFFSHKKVCTNKKWKQKWENYECSQSPKSTTMYGFNVDYIENFTSVP